MNISSHILHQYISLPTDMREFRLLLDDLGLEVKKQEQKTSATNEAPDTIFKLIIRQTEEIIIAMLELHERSLDEQVKVFACPSVQISKSVMDLKEFESELCLRYSLLEMKLEGEDLSLPENVLAPLTAGGIHSITAPIDATNLCNLEIGQPTHTFDADKMLEK